MTEDIDFEETNSQKNSFQVVTASIMCKLNEFGIKIPSHVTNRLPCEFIIIDCLNAEYSESIRRLKRQDVIGLSLEGTDIGRYGTLHYLNISSSTCTYFFNISKLKTDAFNEGLKSIFESQRIVKVVHDCRRVSDCIYHQYKTKLCNVYDTQVAEFVISALKKSPNLISNKVNSLNHCLEHYLSIPKEFLWEKLNSADHTRSFMLKSDVLNFFIKNVIYLRVLKQELDIILRMPFRRCVDIFLQTILRKDDHELKLNPPELGLIPAELVTENLQMFTFSEKLKPQESPKLSKMDDPVARYERDCQINQCGNLKEFQNNFHEEDMENRWRYSDRSEIIQFLLDRMFTADSDNRSVVTMSPFGSSTDDQCSISASMLEDEGILPRKNINNHKVDVCHVSRNVTNMSHVLETKTSNLPFLENKFTTENTFGLVKDINSSTASKQLKECNIENSAVKNKDSTSNSSDFSSSSLSEQSSVYKKFAEQNKLLASQQRLSHNSSVSFNSKHIASQTSSKLNSTDGKESTCNSSQSKTKNSFGSQSSKIPSICKKLQDVLDKQKLTKRQIESQCSSVLPAHELDLLARVKLEDEDCCTVSELGLSSKQKYLEEIRLNQKTPLGYIEFNGNSAKKLAGSQCSPESVLPINELKLTEENQDLDSVLKLNPLISKSDYFKENKISDDSLNSSNLDEESTNNINADQSVDSWDLLRKVFSENEPSKTESQKLKFIPAGMQY